MCLFVVWKCTMKGGSQIVWNSSKNPSVLVWPPFPKRSQSFTKWSPCVVHIVLKWCQVVSFFGTIWRGDVLSECLWSCCNGRNAFIHNVVWMATRAPGGANKQDHLRWMWHCSIIHFLVSLRQFIYLLYSLVFIFTALTPWQRHKNRFVWSELPK